MTRSYRVMIRVNGEGTSVVAQPYVYMGEQDVSGGNVWVLDGAQGERLLWQQLFQGIQDQL